MIGKKVLSNVQEKMEGLLETYREKIDEAYIKAEGGLVVTLQVGFEPNVKRPDFLHVKVAISFTESKVKDMVEGDVSEAQEALFDSPAARSLRKDIKAGKLSISTTDKDGKTISVDKTGYHEGKPV